MTDDLHHLTIAAAAQLIKSRKLSPLEYADALLKRIELHDSQLNAFITVTADLARKRPGHLHDPPDIALADRQTGVQVGDLDRMHAASLPPQGARRKGGRGWGGESVKT